MKFDSISDSQSLVIAAGKAADFSMGWYYVADSL